MDGYDLIGDIHGHAAPLRALLEKLGYRSHGGRYGYRHPSRQAIFLGDFIDRGPGQREVIDIVRGMIDDGAARAVMGNHEFNALAYHTPDPRQAGTHLRRRSAKNQAQHQAFLDEFPPGSPRLCEVLAWFYRLPLWLDLGELRVVHATWDPSAIDYLRDRLSPDHTLSEALLVEASQQGSPAFAATETLLKGLEARLPADIAYTDKSGHRRHHARLRWWRPSPGETWRSMAMIPDPQTAASLPETPLPDELHTGYAGAEPAVFFGHYWFDGRPAPQAANVACLDYSVASPGGKLTAYRWDSETTLRADKFAWVPA